MILDSSVITEYTSSYAKAIAKAIGTCELVRFDNIREKLKQSNQPHALGLKDEHHHLLAKLQTMVLRTRSEKRAKLKELEKNLYKQHNVYLRRTPNMLHLFEITTCQKLLRTMNCQL